MDLNWIKNIVASMKHPKTNGKIERFFDEVVRRIGKFAFVNKIVHWHNVIKPHLSLAFVDRIRSPWLI